MVRRTALVTGASAGIGAALARELARGGFDLVLVARRRERLESLATALEQEFRVRARAIVMDLAKTTAPERLRDELGAAEIPVDVLVNNAGYGVPGTFTETTWDTQRDFLRVMLTSVQHLTHLFVPPMRERRWGRVLNVASVAAYAPARPGSLYGPTKSFLVGATRALALELEGTGVTATALCPGFTYSEFHDVMGTRETVRKLPHWLWMDAETVAREGVQALLKGKIVHVPGRINRLLVTGGRLMPTGLVRSVSAALGVTKRRRG